MRPGGPEAPLGFCRRIALFDVQFLQAGHPRVLLIGRHARLRVLKVSHHGGRGASSSVLLSRLRPTLAVVSAGAGNPFGHLSDDALERYRALAIPVLRTDVEGAVWVGTDGRCGWVRTFAGRATTLGGEACEK